MAFENRLKKDITDQSQGSSSREANAERLRQLRTRASAFSSDYVAQQQRALAERNGGRDKAFMTAAMEAHYQQKEIQRVIKQREGKTSGEIPLGYQREGLRGGGKLSEGSWNSIINSLNSLSDAFNNKDSTSSIEQKLKNLRDQVDRYTKGCDDEDETFLSKIDRDIPENAKSNNFLSKIDNCRQLAESGKSGSSRGGGESSSSSKGGRRNR